MIPRILHQVWVGPDPLPDDFAGYRETWLRHHPDWEHHLWTEDNLPDGFRRPEVYERLRSPVERSDILRYELLWRFGGVYADTDLECHRPVDDLIEDNEFVIAPLKPNGWANTAFVAAAPEHPVFDQVLREITPREYHGYDKKATGPRFFDPIVKDAEGITWLPSTLFYQLTPQQLDDAYATHHAAGSWKTIESYRKAVGLAEGRNFELRGRIEELERELESLKARSLR